MAICGTSRNSGESLASDGSLGAGVGKRLSFAVGMRWGLAQALAVVLIAPQTAFAEPEPEPEPEPEALEEVTTEPPPKDAWHLRFSAGAAYERTRIRYDLAGESRELNITGVALLLQLGIGARLGRDMFAGVLGGFLYVPRSNVDDEWTDNSQTLIMSTAFIDHRLPFERSLHLGAMIGPGFINTFGPEEERFSGWGPVGGIFMGLEGPASRSFRSGLLLQVFGGAMSNSHSGQTK